ncbi:hypothetical protein PPL_04725 [Heterostelium album PN500]|uniref:Uncharacterized protein n=1 Tax=Heterostelium pallidum (strain ATCC 26659 / Pp 5 / PN500) TaxID=670386 RepID=D3B8D3_HETP5|nr:hypothetical protein PPL_04725 [Heterostelium album PN500]EFA82301.1 hypothetical protein PPL_04725 [Heterostelium album PN500]|eukprot:XP_020434418.1 hypothetical protein PPL_04725 [Heterostelium album PN500]
MSSTLRYLDVYPFRYQNGNELSSSLLIVLIILAIYFIYIKLVNNNSNNNRSSSSSSVSDNSNNDENSKEQQLKQLVTYNNKRMIIRELEKMFGAVGVIVLLWSVLEVTNVLRWIEYLLDEDITSTSIQSIESIAKSSNNIVDISITKQIELGQPIQINYTLLFNHRFIRLLSIITFTILIYTLQVIYYTSKSIKSIQQQYNLKEKHQQQQQQMIDISSLYKKEILNEYNSIFSYLTDIPWLFIFIVISLLWMVVRSYLQNVPIHPLSSPMSLDSRIFILHLLSLGSHFSLVIIFYFLYQTINYSSSASTSFSLKYNNNKEKINSISNSNSNNDKINMTDKQQPNNNNNNNNKEELKQEDNDENEQLYSDEVLTKKKKKKKVKQQQQQHQQIQSNNNNNNNDNDIIESSTTSKTIHFDQEGLLFIFQLIMIFQTIYVLFLICNMKLEPFTDFITKSILLIANLISIHYFQSKIFNYLPVCIFLTSFNKFTEKNK